MHRFFSDVPIESDTVELTGSEHQHLTKVLRMNVGEVVMLFDGTGHEFTATIEAVGRNATTLAITDRELVDRELPFDLTLGVALPKGDRQQWLVEKLVELGVTRLTPLVTRRGVAQPGDKAMQRLQRWIVAASKQSRRNRLLEVTAPQTIEQFFSSSDTMLTRLIAHPGSASDMPTVVSSLPNDANIVIAIGPEGGFADEEVVEAVEANATSVDLGKRILRIETAAIAAAACVVFREQK